MAGNWGLAGGHGSNDAAVDAARDAAIDAARDAAVDAARDAAVDAGVGTDAAAPPGSCGSSPDTVWTAAPAQALATLWALGANNVVSSSTAGIMHWDGSAWSLVSPQPPFQGSVRGTRLDDLWVVNTTSFAHYDGSSWSDLSFVPPSGLQVWSFWVSGSDEAWLGAVTSSEQPAIYRLKNGAWSQVASPLDDTIGVYLQAMWGSGPNDIWAGGDQAGLNSTTAVLVHWDGNTWQSVSPAALQKDGQIIEDLWGTSSHDIWAAGGSAATTLAELWHYDGSDWTEATLPTQLQGYFSGLWGSCPSDYWVYSPNQSDRGSLFPSGIPGPLWHFDGNSWSSANATISTYTAGRVAPIQPYGRMTGTSPDDTWVGGLSGRTCFRESTPFVVHKQQGWCGDGTIGPGEQCDPPRQAPDGLQCDSACHLLRCGNGVVEAGEQCDPPTTGHCDQSCQFPTCGNGVVDPGEQCEPPGTSTCDSQCQSIPIVCGNGIQQPGETCDLPNGTACNACTITCCGSCFYANLSLSAAICRPSDGNDCLTSCQAAKEVCSTLSGTARTDCQSLLSCMLPNLGQCAVLNRGLGCYCSDQTCSAGANGPCSAQTQAVAKTTDLAEIKRQLADWTTTLGGVSLEVSRFNNSTCGRACTNGVSVCGYP